MENNQLQLLKKEQESLQLYSGLTAKGIADNIERINAFFPNLSLGFYKGLCERIKANRFTDEEFTEAVDYVTDNYEYPNPSIASFIKYVIQNRERPEEKPIDYENLKVIIDPKKEKEIEDFNAKLVLGHFEKDSNVGQE